MIIQFIYLAIILNIVNDTEKWLSILFYLTELNVIYICLTKCILGFGWPWLLVQTMNDHIHARHKLLAIFSIFASHYTELCSLLLLKRSLLNNQKYKVPVSIFLLCFEQHFYKLLALFRPNLLDVEFEFFAFQNITITSTTLTGSRRDACYKGSLNTTLLGLHHTLEQTGVLFSIFIYHKAVQSQTVHQDQV